MYRKKNQLSFREVNIQDDFWDQILKINTEESIKHQWQQLEKTRCLDNFRILCNEKKGFRQGWYFSDSDAYKWLDAAGRITQKSASNYVKESINTLLDLIRKTQKSDGYLFTYNQIFFPDDRWINLWIEHELYCLGHLIEAIISIFEKDHDKKILDIAIKAANLLVKEFMNAEAHTIPGHQQIEIALIKMYRITNNRNYLTLAGRFIHRRGRSKGKWIRFLQQERSNKRREKYVEKRRKEYYIDHPDEEEFKFSPSAYVSHPLRFRFRIKLYYLSNKYLQNHRPIDQQQIPEGHAVRFTYLMSATAMFAYETENSDLAMHLEHLWNHMVSRRMFVTGGIGSLPVVEGFGRDYELSADNNYCETCAALGSIFWNWEMTLLFPKAKFADLLEWQLYNAALVGVGMDGKSYLYKNPLATKNIERKEWYNVPCCPSNLSRTLASLGKYIYSFNENEIWIHQYIGNKTHIKLTDKSQVEISLKSQFPWDGRVQIELELDEPQDISLYIRIPSWSSHYSVKINGIKQIKLKESVDQKENIDTASGYSPYNSNYLVFSQKWKSGDIIELSFIMGIKSLIAHEKVKSMAGMVTITRGSLIYCLENLDNLDINIFDVILDRSSLRVMHNPNLLNGINTIIGKTHDGVDITFIPYFLWGNRGKSEMSIMVKYDQNELE